MMGGGRGGLKGVTQINSSRGGLKLLPDDHFHSSSAGCDYEIMMQGGKEREKYSSILISQKPLKTIFTFL
jgi:hypothetical protein